MFYHFEQNNSGGRFNWSKDLGTHVVIEADTPEEANDKLEMLGGYFDGCESDRDCPCCGDRWTRQTDDCVGSPTPSVYGMPANVFVKYWQDVQKRTNTFRAWAREDGVPDDMQNVVVVHHKDGRRVAYLLDDRVIVRP